MDKVLAIIIAVAFIWVSFPHVKNGEWVAPTPLPPGWWGLAQAPEYSYLVEPKQGYGWFRFDVWNDTSPSEGRPVYESDFRF